VETSEGGLFHLLHKSFVVTLGQEPPHAVYTTFFVSAALAANNKNRSMLQIIWWDIIEAKAFDIFVVLRAPFSIYLCFCLCVPYRSVFHWQ
jgi:hypothetical protein